MSRLHSLLIYDGNPVDGGTDPVEIGDWSDLRVVFDIDGASVEQLTFGYPRTSAADAECTEGRFLVRQVTDGSVVGTDATSHWLIDRVQRNTTDGMVKVLCLPLSALLGDVWVREMVDGFPNTTIGLADATPTEILTELLANAHPDVSSWIEVGTISYTEPFSFSVSNVSLGAAIQQLAARVGAEWRFRFETDHYEIDLVEAIGASAPVVYVETGKNLVAVEREQSFTDAATHCIAEDGDGRGFWHNAFDITVSGTTFTLVDPLGRDIDPVPFSGCYDGRRIAKDAATYADIDIVTSMAPNTITVSSATGFATGDTCVIRETTGATGDRLTELENAEVSGDYAKRLLPLIRSDIQATRNLVANPFMRTYTNAGAAPDGWTFTNVTGTGATVARSTNNSTYGGFSARVQGAGTCTTFTLVSPLVYPWEKGPDGLHAIRVRLTIATGSALNVTWTVTVDVNASASAAPSANIADAFDFNDADGVARDIALTDIDASALTSGFYVRVHATSSAATTNLLDCYVDVAQCTPGADDPDSYLEGSDANLLLAAAQRAMEFREPPVRSYKIGFADLARKDDTANPYDAITLGGTIAFTSDLGEDEDSLRIVRYELDDDDPLNSVLVVAQRRQRFVNVLEQKQSNVSIPAVAQALAKQIASADFSSSTIVDEIEVVDAAGVGQSLYVRTSKDVSARRLRSTLIGISRDLGVS